MIHKRRSRAGSARYVRQSGRGNASKRRRKPRAQQIPDSATLQNQTPIGTVPWRVPPRGNVENLEAGMSIEEVIEQFPVSREQIDGLMVFVARSLDKEPSYG